MQNIFPLAQEAAIEQTIGTGRLSATTPPDQNVRESTKCVANAVALFRARPRWFDGETVSEWERNAFRHIGNYSEIRNRIIDLYEKNSNYLPLSAVVSLGFSINHSLKVYDFLEDHKIINFEAEIGNILSQVSCEDLGVADNRSGPLHSDRGLFEREESRRVRMKYLKREHLENSMCKCSNMAKYFTSDLLFICSECFTTRNYPNDYSPRNFHEITEELLQTLWTRQEEYVLLKNIESFGDDWARVCEGLNKTSDQCIFHFIKMSIIDDNSYFPKTPFVQVPNPVSTFVAFICSMVYPSISTELAKTAIKFLNNPNLMEILVEVSKTKGREVLETERKKLEKVEKVEIESLIKRIMLKVDAINEMFAEMSAVRMELEDEREKLLEEFSKNS